MDGDGAAGRGRAGLRRIAGAALGLTLMLTGVVALWWPQATGVWNRHAQRMLGDPALRPLPGGAWGRIVIGTIGLDATVVEGVSQADLRKGPGHYPDSARPAQGPVAVAGHRTTWGAPFGRLDALRDGDVIALTVPEGTFRYRVSGAPRATSPGDTAVLSSADLVLTSCHPPGSARRRIIVRAVAI